MNQVLFTIPIRTQWTPDGIPVYGFGLMLFIVFVVCSWLAGRRAEREGISKEKVADVVLWIFLGGLLGARITFMIQYRDRFTDPLVEFFQIWKGGIVFYGSAIGGWLSYLVAKRVLKLNVSSWQLADIFAPSVAIGLSIGRIGCFLNGCCYGHVACPGSPHVEFPLMTAPARDMVWRYQTSTGFAIDPKEARTTVVLAVEPGSAAAQAGLKAGDTITMANGSVVEDPGSLGFLLGEGWTPGKTEVALKVKRGNDEIELPPFVPRTIGLYPTQLYESMTAFLIFCVLVSLYPLRRYDGQVFVWLMICYAVHRYLNEMLRNDTDPVAFGLTLSQNVSILILTAGIALGLWRRRYPRTPSPTVQPPVSQPA